MVHNGWDMTVFEQPAETAEQSAARHGGSPTNTATEPASQPSEPEIETAPGGVETETVPPPAVLPDVALGVRVQLHTFQRITGVVGMLCLIAGLAVWRFKPHSDDRLALVILVCAMFLAILHHYSMEENRRSNQRRQ